MDLKYTIEKYLNVDKFLTQQPSLEKLFAYVSESMDNLKNFISSHDDAIRETIGEEQYDRGFEDGSDEMEANIDDERSEAFDDGFKDGHDEGYEEGESSGLCEGENRGYDKGHESGYNEGHTKGFEAGLAEAARIAKLLQP